MDELRPKMPRQLMYGHIRISTFHAALTGPPEWKYWQVIRTSSHTTATMPPPIPGAHITTAPPLYGFNSCTHPSNTAAYFSLSGCRSRPAYCWTTTCPPATWCRVTTRAPYRKYAPVLSISKTSHSQKDGCKSKDKLHTENLPITTGCAPNTTCGTAT